MNADLEETLRGEDLAEMRAFVASLRTVPQARVSATFTSGVMAAVRAGGATGRNGRRPVFAAFRPAWAWAVAASLVAVLAVGVLFHGPSSSDMSVPGALPEGEEPSALSSLVACQRADGTFSSSSASPYVQAFAVTALAKERVEAKDALKSAVGALVRGQRADGGWPNARLSACNVLALQTAVDAGVAEARPAYRRGLRYLHVQGIGELSLRDLVQEAKTVYARLGDSADPGLVRSASLCASL